MAAATAFYAPLRGLRDAVGTIIEINSQMTTLVRVMDEGSNFEKILRTNIDLANQLGRSIADVNASAIEFARMGFNEEQITHLARSATLAQNISELTSEQATDALTAAMTVFNIRARESISIVDKLNEVDITSLPA